jgi:hypothetical protein
LNSGENPRRTRLSVLGFRIRDIVSTFQIVSTKSGEGHTRKVPILKSFRTIFAK